VVGPGTAYQFTTDWVSWWGAPDVRTSDLERSGAHGVTAGRDFLGKHTTPFVVQIMGDTASDLGDKVDVWKEATAVSVDTVVMVSANLLGRTRARFGRFRRSEVLPRGLVTTGGYVANGAAQFEALDPRTYSETLNSLSTRRTTEGTGFTPPFVPPFTLGTSVGGSMTVTNAGNMAAPWAGTLAGPLSYPVVSHVESGRRLALQFSANGGVVLGAADTLVLDSDRRSVMLNGVADRRTQLTVDSQWWDLEPGDNTFTLDADGGEGSLTVQWRDTYWS
jgi:hypothetical protein